MKYRIKWVYRNARRLIRIKRYSVHNRFSLADMQGKEALLFLIHSAQNGGAPLLALYVVRELKRLGYNIVTVCLEPGPLIDEFVKQGLVFIPYGVKDFEKMLGDLAELNIEKCICNSALTGGYVRTLKNHRCKIISLIHELPNTIEKSCAKNSTVNMIKYSDKVVFPSTLVRDRCYTYLKIDAEEKVYIKPQGLYLREATVIDKAEKKQMLAQKYNFSFEKPLIINVGSTITRKGFDLFVELAKIDSSKTYLWVGIQKNQLYEECVKKCNGHLPNNFVGLGFIKDAEQLTEIYAAADVLALTSREEPFGSVVLEAFSCGTPVCAFDNCGGFVDVVINNETGELVPSVTAESMLKAINHIISDSQNYAKLSNSCFELAKSMNFENYVQFLLDLF